MQKRKSRAYYQYMLDLADQKVGYYSSDDISLIAYDLLDDGDEEEALAACEKGLDLHPDDDLVLIVKAKVLARMHRFDESERLLRINPDKSSPFGISIRFAIDIDRLGDDEALSRLINDFERDLLTPQEVVDVIDEHFDELQHNVASTHLLKLAQMLTDVKTHNEEQLAEALGRVGALLMDCNCHREAIAVLERALDYDAYDVYSWQDLSRCQFELCMYDACEQSCEMGLAIDPQNPLFNFALGFIRCDQRRYNESIDHLEVCRKYAEGKIKHEDIHLDRQEMEQQRNITYELLGTSYQAINKVDKAIECYQTLVRRIPSFAEGYHRLAILYADQGKADDAMQCADIAVSLAPDNISFLTLHMTLNTEMQNFPEALNDLDKLIEINPKSKTYLLAKAELSLTLKKFAEADSAYRSLLKLHPKDETSRSMMRAYFEAIGDEEALRKLQ